VTVVVGEHGRVDRDREGRLVVEVAAEWAADALHGIPGVVRTGARGDGYRFAVPHEALGWVAAVLGARVPTG
jgi:hypothetical protein